MASLTKSNLPSFVVQVFQNEYLPVGGREVNAVVTVTSTGGGTTGGLPLSGDGGAGNGAVVIMVDCSGSMDYPSTKIRAARDATVAAINAVRDGAAFAVVAGTHEAAEIYPGNGRMAVAGPDTRDQARAAVQRLVAGGGTAIGSWLRLADRLLAAQPSAVRHAILLTDGRNEHEEPARLAATLDACAGRFTCDCRGVGTDWEVEELRRISSALLGTFDIVADPAKLEADFRAMMTAAMGKAMADVGLRMWTPQNAAVRFVKQVAPHIEDLTDRAVESGPRSADYPTGSWGDESRDYHVCVDVPSFGIGQEMLACRISLVLPHADGTEELLSQGLVRAVWTDDTALSTRINHQVAHYTGQAELAEAIQQGLEARKAGDVDRATARLGRAVALANASGNDDTARLLAKVVDVLDPATGTVRLKRHVEDVDEMTLDSRSTKTVRVKK